MKRINPSPSLGLLKAHAGETSPQRHIGNCLAVGVCCPDDLRCRFCQRTIAFLAQFERTFRLFMSAYIHSDFHNQRRTIGITERIIKNVVVFAIRAEPFPILRLVCFQNIISLAVFTRLGTVKQIFVAFPSFVFAETVFKKLIGISHVIIRSEQYRVSRKHIKHILETFSFGFYHLFRFASKLNLLFERLNRT
ncbi:MAG: hypothetical protein BWY69_00486 [Planctomycetes bacterium ADurb.Bin401]|nr:MAG: hypothetical protein BWY69_00486 [Planctomycetes bacterium ADurb.Bin401]